MPISALRFISPSLRRTGSTPRATRLARPDLVLFTKSSKPMNFFESIKPRAGLEESCKRKRALTAFQAGLFFF
jgi:hypothetical protein